MYGVTAAAIDTDAGPSHPSSASRSITDWYEAAVELSSAASPSHAATAASMGVEPGPE